MKNIRIIPRLDIKGPNVVKTVHTEGLRVVGKPKEFALRYCEEGADEIIYIDIVASLYQRNLDFDQLKSVTDNIFIPFTVGGGIRSIHDINNALRAGADKVAVNTYAISHPEFLAEAAKKFGSQCIVLSIEAKRIASGKWEAYTDGGREHSQKDAVEWIKQGIALGAGEILLTSIDRDGTKKGYDLELIENVTSFAPIPVIVHGGAGNPEDILLAIQQGQADAVSASSIYHYKIFNIQEVKQDLAYQGINIRQI